MLERARGASWAKLTLGLEREGAPANVRLERDKGGPAIDEPGGSDAATAPGAAAVSAANTPVLPSAIAADVIGAEVAAAAPGLLPSAWEGAPLVAGPNLEPSAAAADASAGDGGGELGGVCSRRKLCASKSLASTPEPLLQSSVPAAAAAVDAAAAGGCSVVPKL